MKGLKCFLLVLCGISTLAAIVAVIYHRMYLNAVLGYLRPDGGTIFMPSDEEPTSFGETETQLDE